MVVVLSSYFAHVKKACQLLPCQVWHEFFKHPNKRLFFFEQLLQRFLSTNVLTWVPFYLYFILQWSNTKTKLFSHLFILLPFYKLQLYWSHWIKEDHRSYLRNFCSCEKKAWKKFSLVRDSNSWPLRYRCSALPIKLTIQLGAGRWIGSL